MNTDRANVTDNVAVDVGEGLSSVMKRGDLIIGKGVMGPLSRYPSRGRILLSLKTFASVLDSPFAVDAPGFRR